MVILRLQKYLADCGIASRRKCEELIQKGLVKVNEIVTTELGTKIDSEKDKIEYNNKEIKPKNKFIYIMLNKPIRYVTSMDQKGKRTVKELTKQIKERIFPVGRLDEYSQGLLLMTNDGDMAYKLTHPKFEHEKEYIVQVTSEITCQQIKQLETGIEIEGEKTWPAKIKRNSKNEFNIIIHEGRNRQIRKMCEELGLTVKMLKRIRIGPIILKNLAEGQWRYLTGEELNKLKEFVRTQAREPRHSEDSRSK